MKTFSACCRALCVGLLLVGCSRLFLGCQTADGSATARTFRVMTYNIHHGEGLDRKVDLARIAALIQREQADIVALQEVDKGVERTARRDLPAELAALTGMTCLFSNNYHYQGGEYGNAVLTRFPVQQWTNTHYRMVRSGEQRGLLQAVLLVQGRELAFFDTHVDFHSEDAERLLNVGEIQNRLAPYRPRPVVLCGDFNDTPQSRTYAKLAEQFMDSWTVAGTGNAMTIPAANPNKRIDYIWVSKDSALVPLKSWVVPSEASDHLPVVAELRWR